MLRRRTRSAGVSSVTPLTLALLGGGELRSGKLTPVSCSDSSHSRRAVSASRAASLRPTSVGWPRPSWKPSGPT